MIVERHRRARWVALAAAPMLLLLAVMPLLRARGPLWLGLNSDPSYQYLFNSLVILNGQPPCHVDHPGTPVQTFGAAVLGARLPGADTLAKTDAALRDPERALGAIQAGLIAVTSLAWVLAGILVYAGTGSLLSAIVVQAVPLLEMEVWRGLLYVAPEALLPALTVVLIALVLMRDVPGTGHRGRVSPALVSVAIGLVSGAALVTKVTFLPLCLLPLLTTRSVRLAAWTILATLVSAIVFIAPAATQIPRMLHWFTQLASHTGTYGSGPDGLIDPQHYAGDLWHLLIAEPIFALTLAASVAIAVSRRAVTDRDRDLRRVLVTTIFVQLAALALVAKHPSPHYLVPTMVSLGINIAAGGALLRIRRLEGSSFATGAAIVVAAVTIAAIRLVRLDAALQRQQDIQRADVAAAAALPAGSLQVPYYRQSSVAFALHFGNGGAWRMFGQPLDALYPGHVFFDRLSGKFETFARRISVDHEGRTIYLMGSAAPGELAAIVPARWKWQRVSSSPTQAIDRLAPVQEP